MIKITAIQLKGARDKVIYLISPEMNKYLEKKFTHFKSKSGLYRYKSMQ